LTGGWSRWGGRGLSRPRRPPGAGAGHGEARRDAGRSRDRHTQAVLQAACYPTVAYHRGISAVQRNETSTIDLAG